MSDSFLGFGFTAPLVNPRGVRTGTAAKLRALDLDRFTAQQAAERLSLPRRQVWSAIAALQKSGELIVCKEVRPVVYQWTGRR